MKIFTFLSALMLTVSFCMAQNTLILQPGSLIGKDAIIHGLSTDVNKNYGDNEQFVATAWTFGGPAGVVRSAIDFDWSAIPANAVIVNASLSLHAINNTSGMGYHSALSGSNECLLQRITSNWSENTVTWNTQPSTTTANEVYMSGTSDPHKDYHGIDVTHLVKDIVSHPDSGFGFMMKLKTESYYRRLNFASSDHAIDSLHPKLTITYTLPYVTVLLQPDAGNGKDAIIHGLSTDVNKNYGDNEQFVATAWTFGGPAGVVRSAIDFDWSAIPANAVIVNASLSLHAINNTSGMGYHSALSGSNECLLQRITSNWSENTVTWNTQPSTTTANEVYMSGTSDPHKDYHGIDVTQLVKDIVSHPDSGFGFMMKLKTESYYRRLNFASSDHAIDSLHPILKVTYKISTDTVVKGCMDPQSVNYNALATVEDGSCKAIVWGCLDPYSLNYNTLANKSNDYCLYKDSVIVINGCTEPLAINYNPFANADDQSCITLPVVVDEEVINTVLKDTVSVRPLINCVFDYSLAVDSIKILTTNIVASHDSTSIDWEIYQGNKSSTLRVKYLVETPGMNLFILSLICNNGSNKKAGAIQGVTMGAVQNVSVVTGIQNTIKETNLVVYPNPALNEINLSGEVEGIQKVEVYSLLGQKLFFLNGTEKKIDISTLPAGNYLIKVQYADGAKMLKFVK